VADSDFAALEVCVLLGDNANAWSFYGNKVGNDCGSGVVLSGNGSWGRTVSGALGNQFYGNTFQTKQPPVCGAPCAAGTCCGGYFHGSTCATLADCKEALYIDLAERNSLLGGYFEDQGGNAPMILLGCAAQAGGPCPANDSTSGPTILGVRFYPGTGHISVGTNLAATPPPMVMAASSGAATAMVGAWVGEGPYGATSSIACATTNPGQGFYDTDCDKSCFCNGQATPGPRYCRQDTGVCGSTTTDCC
jgi:hypothetical protein